MATVVEVQQSKPKVESFTVKLSVSDARDIQTYIKSYYLKNGYGKGYEENVGLFKTIRDGLEGKVSTTGAFAPF